MKKLYLFFCLLVSMTLAQGHEATENRATLVLRDNRHLAVTLYLNYAEAMHQAIMPARPFEEFILTHSAMDGAMFQRAALQAQMQFQNTLKIYNKDRSELKVARWQWPAPILLQQSLRESAMLLLRGSAAHAHAAPLEIHAELSAEQDVEAVSIQFPAEFQKVLVVFYRPSQVTVERKAVSPLITF